MANVVPLPRPADAECSDHELLRQALDAIAALSARLAEFEARLPPPKFELPRGWLAIKQASALCGVPEPTLYRWTRQGRIMSVKRGFRVFIDPADKEITRIIARA